MKAEHLRLASSREEAEDAEGLDVESAYREHRSGVLNYLVRTGTSREAAEDLTQGTFLVLLGKGVLYDRRRGPLLSYLVGVARNLRRAWQRRERRSESAGAVEEAAAGGLLASERLLIEEALRRLPADLRETIVLREIEGYCYREIAAAQRIPIGTVRSRIAAARKSLRRSLAPRVKE